MTENVKMPAILKRRFKLEYDKYSWFVIDSFSGKTIRKGNYQDVIITWHNLNKKFYQELNSKYIICKTK
jgi:hypothetical protein